MRFIIAATVALALTPLGAAATQCPDFTLPAGKDLSYSEDDLWSERRHGVTAGGNLSLWNCPQFDAVGFVTRQPDFHVYLSSNTKDRKIRFKITGDDGCDTVLLINTPGAAWLFNDDDEGLDPVIRVRSAQAGRYDIWAGTFGPDACIATLHLEAFP